MEKESDGETVLPQVNERETTLNQAEKVETQFCSIYPTPNGATHN